MAEVDYFDHFELPWATGGAVEAISEQQWQAGWSFIGATPPSVEQFNKLQQVSDQKSAWFFRQFKQLAQTAQFLLAADKDDALVRGIQALIRKQQIPGQVMVFAGTAAPAGTLLCDGAAVSREDYADLFAAIGTLYGAGDGVSTFNLPRVDEDTGVLHTADPAKVGQVSDGSVIAHTHPGSTTAAGGHAHGASASAEGEHVHGAWTDNQGNHWHTGGTSGAGEHTHATEFINNGAVDGADLGGAAFIQPIPGGRTSVGTNAAGHHAHAFTTDAGGVHYHGVGIHPAGAHGHTVSVAEVGDHVHEISVTSTGTPKNLPAGIRMLYCITY